MKEGSSDGASLCVRFHERDLEGGLLYWGNGRKWVSASIGTQRLGNMEGHFFLRAFLSGGIFVRFSRYMQMSCKRVSLSIGEPGGGSFVGLSERKKKYIWVPFLDPEDVKILRLGAIWNFIKGTGFF